MRRNCCLKLEGISAWLATREKVRSEGRADKLQSELKVFIRLLSYKKIPESFLNSVLFRKWPQVDGLLFFFLFIFPPWPSFLFPQIPSSLQTIFAKLSQNQTLQKNSGGISSHKTPTLAFKPFTERLLWNIFHFRNISRMTVISLKPSASPWKE